MIAHPPPSQPATTSASARPVAGPVTHLRAGIALCLAALLLLWALSAGILHRRALAQEVSQSASASVPLLAPESDSLLALLAVALLTGGLPLLLAGARGASPSTALPPHWAALPQGVLVQDGSGAVVEANAEAERLLGLTLAQLQGHQPWPFGWRLGAESTSADAVGQDALAALPAARVQRLGLAVRDEALRLELPGGEQRWLAVDCAPLVAGNGPGGGSGSVSCIRDISQEHGRRLRQIRLAHGERSAGQPRLPGQVPLMTRLEHVIAHAERHAGYGHALLAIEVDWAGPGLSEASSADLEDLRHQVEQRLAQSLRPGDALELLDAGQPRTRDSAAHFGAHFGASLEGIASRSELEPVVLRLLDDLAAPFLIGCDPVQLVARLGAVLCAHDGPHDGPHDGVSEVPALAPEDLLRQALVARGEVQRSGPGGWALYDGCMKHRAAHANAIHTDLLRALEREELFLCYQPVLDLVDGALRGVDALLRWRHPQRGLVDPPEFVQVAEATGLTKAIDDWTLRRACADLAQWRRTLGAQAPAVVAVKLSHQQLQRADLADELARLLTQYPLPPACLRLEWSEAHAELDEAGMATLRRLKNMGLGLGLDDFGSGQPSLARLQQIPLDLVKIEQGLVRQAGSKESQLVRVEATARVAAGLGICTVAKGVQTQAQASLMRQLRCDGAAGPHYGTELTAQALEDWLRARTAVTA